VTDWQIKQNLYFYVDNLHYQYPLSRMEKRSFRIWPIIVLAILIILCGTGYYFYNNYLAGDKWKPLLQQELKQLVLKSTDSLYHIQYSDFDLNITSGNATVSDFKLIPDTLIYQKLVAQKKAPDNLFTLSVKKLSIKNVGAKKAYQEKILDIDNISVEEPNLTVVNQRYSFNDTVKVGKPKTPYEIIKKIFKRLSIGSISLKDISVNYINKSNPVVKHTALKHLDIDVANILIDSLSAQDTSRFYYTKGVDIVLHDYKITTPDDLYNISLKKIYFSTAQRKIILDKVSFVPKYNPTAFYRKTGVSGDIFTLKFKQIDINDLDLQRFLRDQKLYAGVMNVSNSTVQIYSNNAYKGKKSIKIGTDPHQALQKLALDINLHRLNIKNTDVSYSETDATTLATGIIFFKNTNGYILNLTNDRDIKKRNHFMVVHIKTKFMDVAPFQVNFKFNLTAKDGAFNYAGTLGSFDGRVLDKLVKPLAMVHIKSADVQQLTFNVDASNYHGKGNLEFYYKNLHIDILKKVEGKTELQSQGLISHLANSIIANDNPNKKGVFRPGPIDVDREPTVSFFSFLYKALLEGLKPSVGVDKKTETKVNNIATKVSSFISKFSKKKKDSPTDDEKKKTP